MVSSCNSAETRNLSLIERWESIRRQSRERKTHRLAGQWVLLGTRGQKKTPLDSLNREGAGCAVSSRLSGSQYTLFADGVANASIPPDRLYFLRRASPS